MKTDVIYDEHLPASLKTQLNEDDHTKTWFDGKTLKNGIPLNINIHDEKPIYNHIINNIDDNYILSP